MRAFILDRRAAIRYTWIVLRSPTAAALAVVLLSGLLPAAQERPLPDPKAFLAEVRKHLHRDRVLQSQYTYSERRTRYERDGSGKPKQSVRVYEVHPSIDEELTYERLMSVDGKPVSAADLAAADREHAEKVREHSGPDARERLKRKQAEELEKERRAIDELFQMFDVVMAGREWIDGHPLIVFRLTPRAAYRPKTREARIMKKFRVQAWISENDYQVAKVEAEAMETVLIGRGVLARLDKGSHGYFQRRKVNDEIWLPSETRFTGTGRLLMLKKINLDQKSEFSDYKKFDVDTATTFDLPK